MKIIEYEDKYLEDVRDLLVELEEYIVSIDKDELDHVHPEYRDKMALLDLFKIEIMSMIITKLISLLIKRKVFVIFMIS